MDDSYTTYRLIINKNDDLSQKFLKKFNVDRFSPSDISFIDSKTIVDFSSPRRPHLIIEDIKNVIASMIIYYSINLFDMKIQLIYYNIQFRFYGNFRTSHCRYIKNDEYLLQRDDIKSRGENESFVADGKLKSILTKYGMDPTIYGIIHI